MLDSAPVISIVHRSSFKVRRLIFCSVSLLCLCMLSLIAVGCVSNKPAADQRQSGPYGDVVTSQNRKDTSSTSRHQSNAADATSPADKRTIAFVGGQPITAAAMFPQLLDYAGGQTLSQMVLDAQIDRKLTERRLIISQDMVEAERQQLLNELSNDPDEAVRLLKELRDSRGVGNDRFTQTLRRNAALRLLSKDESNISEQDIRLAFELQYGEKYEARLITTRTLGQMQQILAQMGNGADFIEMAIARSTDPSSAQGGLLPPLSGADATYPAAVRNVLVGLKPGEVSHPIALDNSYAILKLERKIQGEDVKFDDVKSALTLSVQRQQQQTQMRLLARTLLEQADVVVLDPVLKQSWDRQKQLMSQNP